MLRIIPRTLTILRHLAIRSRNILRSSQTLVSSHLLLKLQGTKNFSGPKMYIATRDTDQCGSTPLHVDATCAVNILAYSHSDGSGNSGARWLIFRREDIAELREYLQGAQRRPTDDPIHTRSVFVTNDMLQELANRGVIPYRIHQRPGEAVFIPAGCAHQVSAPMSKSHIVKHADSLSGQQRSCLHQDCHRFPVHRGYSCHA